MNFEPDPDDGTLPPGVVSRQAKERMLELTGTAPEQGGLAKQGVIRDKAFLEKEGPDPKEDPEKGGFSETALNSGKPRSKWKHAEIKRLATPAQWDYGLQYGSLDVGTVCAVGNLLLKGMSPTAVRKALGITPRTWSTWYAKGYGDTHAHSTDDSDDALPQAPYNVFAFVVDHSQAVMELRAVQGWTGHFDRDWKAAQAYLVARNPDEWNPISKSTIDTTTKTDITVVKQDTNDWLEVYAILERANALPSRTETKVIEVESVEVISTDTDRSESHTDDQ